MPFQHVLSPEAKSVTRLLIILKHLDVTDKPLTYFEMNIFSMRHLSIEAVLAARLSKFIGMKNTPEVQAQIRMVEHEVRIAYAQVVTSRQR